MEPERSIQPPDGKRLIRWTAPTWQRFWDSRTVLEIRSGNWPLLAKIALPLGFIADFLTVILPIAQLFAFSCFFISGIILITTFNNIPEWRYHLRLAIIYSVAGALFVAVVKIQHATASEDRGALATHVPGFSLLQEKLKLIETKVSKIDDTTQKIDQTTQRIEILVEDQSRKADQNMRDIARALAENRRFTTGPRPAPIITEIMSTSYYNDINKPAIQILEEFDGRTVFIDTVNEDQVIDDHFDVINNCRNGNHFRDDNEFIIPTTDALDRNICGHIVKLKFKNEREIPTTHGGTGLNRYLVRSYFKVTRTVHGVRIFYLLEEISDRD